MVTVVIRTIIIYIVLALTMRIMGKRQIGELEISELIVTFMLSELATIPISDTDVPLFNAIAPILLLLSIEGMLSFATLKIPILKKLLYGKPSILIQRGRLDQAELKNQRIELSELLCAVRQSGVASLEDVSFAILEENGKISVFPKSSEAPVTPDQMSLTVEDDGVSLPLIMDGRIIKENMRLRGWNLSVLKRTLDSRRLKTDEVFLLSVDDSDNIYIIKKEENK